MAQHPMAPGVNPYGPTAPAGDFQVITAGTLVTLDPPARTFVALADGVVSVRTLKGNTRTETLPAGTYPCMIDQVLAATAVDLLVYQY